MLDLDQAGRLASAGAVGAALVRLALARRAAPDLEVDVREDRLVVRLYGWDALWAMRRRVVVPLADVAGVSVVRADSLPWRGLPLRGTGVPGLLLVGTVRAGDGAEFWNVRAGAAALLRVELRGRTRHRRLLLQVAEPQAAAVRLRQHVAAWVPALV